MSRLREKSALQLERELPVMMHSIDRHGRIISVSDLWLRTLGYKRAEVLGRPSVDFLTPESAEYARRMILPAFYRTGSCSNVPYTMVKKSGEVVEVRLSATAQRDESGRVARSFAVLIDVTELVRTKAWFEAMIESSTDAIVSVAPDGRFLRVNAAFERLTGYSRAELLRRRFENITAPGDLPASVEAWRRIRSGRGPSSFEKEYVRKDGSRVPALVTVFAVEDPKRRTIGYAAIVRDLTDRKKLEKEVLEVGAREQSRLGRELHDSLGQELTGLSLMARMLSTRLAKAGRSEAAQARKIAESAAGAVEQARALAAGLMPSELMRSGLPAALRELASRAERLFGLSCVVRAPATMPKLPDVTLVHLYRIAQESLTNAAKHGRARRALIEVLRRRRELELRVTDDGAGFDDAAAGRGGMGLEIMRHRAGMLGGSFAISRGRGGGTVVRVSFHCAA